MIRLDAEWPLDLFIALVLIGLGVFLGLYPSVSPVQVTSFIGGIAFVVGCYGLLIARAKRSLRR